MQSFFSCFLQLIKCLNWLAREFNKQCDSDDDEEVEQGEFVHLLAEVRLPALQHNMFVFNLARPTKPPPIRKQEDKVV